MNVETSRGLRAECPLITILPPLRLPSVRFRFRFSRPRRSRPAKPCDFLTITHRKKWRGHSGVLPPTWVVRFLVGRASQDDHVKAKKGEPLLSVSHGETRQHTRRTGCGTRAWLQGTNDEASVRAQHTSHFSDRAVRVVKVVQDGRAQHRGEGVGGERQMAGSSKHVARASRRAVVLTRLPDHSARRIDADSKVHTVTYRRYRRACRAPHIEKTITGAESELRERLPLQTHQQRAQAVTFVACGAAAGADASRIPAKARLAWRAILRRGHLVDTPA